MPNVTLNGYYVHTYLSFHSHFNILVTKEGDVAKFSHHNLNYTPSSFTLQMLTVESKGNTWGQKEEYTDVTI